MSNILTILPNLLGTTISFFQKNIGLKYGNTGWMTSGKMVRLLEGLRWMPQKMPTAMIWLVRAMKCPVKKPRMRHSSQKSRNTAIENRIVHIIMLL